MRFITFALALVAAFATSVSFTDCGSKHLSLSDVDISPYPVAAGRDLSLTMSGSLAKLISSGKFNVDVYYGSIKLSQLQGDVCTDLKGVSCPQSAGNVRFSYSYHIPAIAPPGKYKLQVSAKDQDGEQAVCFSALAQVGGRFDMEAPEVDFHFDRFVEEYNRTYETQQERSIRRFVFSQNMDMINEHNARNEPWTMAANEFTDYTWEEFRATHLGLDSDNLNIEVPDLTSFNYIDVDTSNAPASVDWNAAGAVTPVKNQGSCGSCWSFSTTGAIEGAFKLATGKLVSLSEQQLVDCSGRYGNQGCNGGLMDNAFKYVINNHGICAESSYPYTAAQDSCRSTCSSAASISDYKDVSWGEKNLLNAVAKQPVAVAIEADQKGFQFYKSGVFTGTCGTNLDHGVLAVGYGTESGTDYWLVKNSWGASWGDNGFIKLVRKNGLFGQCGIAMRASYPIA